MKVVSSKEMAEIESQAYSEGASESEFMEEAGSGVALVAHDYVERHDLARQAVLLCAKGNNSGDAYVAGVDLLHLDYDVTALQITPIEEASQLCKQNYARFIHEGGVVKEISKSEEIVIPLNGIVIDAIFGTGFHGELKDPFASIMQAINDSRIPIISVDIPSGLNGETGEAAKHAIRATETAFLGLPKKGFFLQNGWDHIGKLRYVDFGLDEKYIDNFQAEVIMLTTDMLKPKLPPLVASRHKYQAGYVVGVAGSPGMPGAALLASWSAIASGAGMIRLMHPPGMEAELSGSTYEVIKTPYTTVDEILVQMKKASALFVGPGIGTDDKAAEMLKELLKRTEIPCVLDADALTIIGRENLTLPKQAILTPHRGEMGRLLGEKPPETVDLAYLHKCRDYAAEKGVTLILKGGPSFVLQKDQPIYVNSIGDPGMATAGCGDVLTGLLASLLAQGVSPLDAANLGIYIHAFAGECAADFETSYCMTASNVVEHFPDAFHALLDKMM
jgi:NAD(P)H-hydrate epimerase